jgi:phosphonate transport system ATP-binding protein
MSAAVLSVRQLSATFGTTRALDAVSLEVGRGEMVALIGPSGSGKSTLLRAIAGLSRRGDVAGRIEAFGETVRDGARLSPNIRAIRCRIGFVFQQFNLVGRLSLFTNVALGALGRMGLFGGLLGRWPRAVQTQAMAALDRVGVAAYAGQRANTLSGGQQQRGAIARALVQQAKLVLADEPVASLDPVSARRVMDILRELNRQDGLTVLVTLHQVDFALAYCDRVIALSEGRIAYDGPAPDLDADRLARIYGPQYAQALGEAGKPQEPS